MSGKCATALDISKAALEDSIETINADIQLISLELQEYSKKIQPSDASNHTELNACAAYCIKNWHIILSTCEKHKYKLLSYMNTGIKCITEKASLCLYNEVLFNLLGMATSMQPSLNHRGKSLPYTIKDPAEILNLIEALASKILNYWESQPEKKPGMLQPYYQQVFYIWQQQVGFGLEAIKSWGMSDLDFATESLELNCRRLKDACEHITDYCDIVSNTPDVDGKFRHSFKTDIDFYVKEHAITLLTGYHEILIRIEDHAERAQYQLSRDGIEKKQREALTQTRQSFIKKSQIIKIKMHEVLSEYHEAIPEIYLAGFYYDIAETDSKLEEVCEKIITLNKDMLPNFILESDDLEAITHHKGLTPDMRKPLAIELGKLTKLTKKSEVARKRATTFKRPNPIMVPENTHTRLSPPPRKKKRERPASTSKQKKTPTPKRKVANLFLNSKPNKTLQQLRSEAKNLEGDIRAL